MNYLLCAIFFEDPVETLIDEIEKLRTIFSEKNIRVKIFILVRPGTKHSPNKHLNEDFPGSEQEVIKIFNEPELYSVELNQAIQDNSCKWMLMTHEKERVQSEKYFVLLSHINTGYEIIILGRKVSENNENKIEKLNNKHDLASIFARMVFPDVYSPLSEDFLINTEVLHQVSLDVKPNLLLEILAKGHWRRVLDIPYIHGQETYKKLHFVRIGEIAVRILKFFIYSLHHHDSRIWIESIYAIKFIIVGLSGVILNMGLLFALTEYAGVYYLYSSILAIEASILNNFFWNEVWTFKKKESTLVGIWWKRLVSYHIFSIVGIVLNITLLYILTEKFGVYYLISNIIGILAVFLWNYLINRRVTWRSI